MDAPSSYDGYTDVVLGWHGCCCGGGWGEKKPGAHWARRLVSHRVWQRRSSATRAQLERRRPWATPLTLGDFITLIPQDGTTEGCGRLSRMRAEVVPAPTVSVRRTTSSGVRGIHHDSSSLLMYRGKRCKLMFRYLKLLEDPHIPRDVLTACIAARGGARPTTPFHQFL